MAKAPSARDTEYLRVYFGAILILYGLHRVSPGAERGMKVGIDCSCDLCFRKRIVGGVYRLLSPFIVGQPRARSRRHAHGLPFRIAKPSVENSAKTCRVI